MLTENAMPLCRDKEVFEYVQFTDEMLQDLSLLPQWAVPFVYVTKFKNSTMAQVTQNGIPMNVNPILQVGFYLVRRSEYRTEVVSDNDFGRFYATVQDVG